jgi:hypothetical protein
MHFNDAILNSQYIEVMMDNGFEKAQMKWYDGQNSECDFGGKKYSRPTKDNPLWTFSEKSKIVNLLDLLKEQFKTDRAI